MIIKIPDLLNPTQLEAVCSVLRQGEFIDGKLSAGDHAKSVKHNQELDSSQPRYKALNDVVMSQLVQHPDYLQAAMPAKICAPIYARYTRDMSYGGHIDDPIMGSAGARYRADISISIFLNPPEEYEGGELCIETGGDGAEFKLPAGHALLYPSTSYHAVKPLISGERLVAVTWVQSCIRRADQREILVMLDRARKALGGSVDDPGFQQLNLAYTNLFRMWAEL